MQSSFWRRRIVIIPTIKPRALRNPDTITDRRSKLNLRHIVPLRDFALSLRSEGRGAVPDFDPLDGGVDAKILFVMEKPGRMTDRTAYGGKVGSGFVSRDNDDPTAEAIWRFMAQAGVERSLTVLWNIVPWWNGKLKVTAEEERQGLVRLGQLVALLPNLAVVVAVGRRAEEAQALVTSRGLPFYASAHPSPIVRATRFERWAAIPHDWARALPHM